MNYVFHKDIFISLLSVDVFCVCFLTIFLISFTFVSDSNIVLQFVFNNVSHIESHCGVLF